MIPVNTPQLDGNEAAYVAECIETGWISSEGPFVGRFEDAFAARVDRRFGIACSSGSAALDLAVAALHLGPGDEVILPTLTIISPAASVVRAGGTPVLVDSDPVTWNAVPEQIEAKITPRTKAILVVHLYGLPADLDPVLAIAERHQLAVIEDAAEMHGQTYRGRPCGSFGTLSTFSFYPNKHITTGEGGMVVTNDEQLAARCRGFRNLCFQPSPRFVHEELGWNYRITNLQAAVGLAQLERLDPHVARKREIGRLYRRHFEQEPRLEMQPERTEYAENIYWVNGLVLDDSVPARAQEVCAALGAKKIGTRPFFWPMHEQPVFQKRGLFEGESYPVAERLARRGFYVPSGLGLRDEEVQTVADELVAVLDQRHD